MIKKILEKIQQYKKQNLPFVVYRKPNEKVVSAFFQKTNDLFYITDYQESGFVFTPFNDTFQSVLIPESQSDFLQEKINISTMCSSDNVVLHSVNENSKKQHIDLVEKGIEAIKQQQFKKVVLSRKEVLDVPNFDLLETYQRLLVKYPTAFVYVWFHPKVGLWLGATPETLIKVKDNEFETMSLAGTQPYNGTLNVKWQEKELEEQQFVTDYIVGNLASVSEALTISEVKTIKAGSLLHLQTTITGTIKTQTSDLVGRLHPTPAVCGLPKQTSKEFIIKKEDYNREFYTGFLGELNLVNSKDEKSSNLYVNLRCMQIKNTQAEIYVGGGITKDSNAQNEWKETVAKSQIMKHILF